MKHLNHRKKSQQEISCYFDKVQEKKGIYWIDSKLTKSRHMLIIDIFGLCKASVLLLFVLLILFVLLQIILRCITLSGLIC